MGRGNSRLKEAADQSPVQAVPVKSTTRGLQPEPADATPVKKGRNFILLIAIDYYAQPNLNLSNSVRDAARLVEVLLERYEYSLEKKQDVPDLRETDSGRYPQYFPPLRIYNDKYVKCLYNEDATKGKIFQAIAAIKASLQEGDNFLVYYAGHGFKRAASWYLVTHEYDPNIVNEVPFRELYDRDFSNADPYNLLFILDSCFSGNVLQGLMGNDQNKHARVTITSTADGVADDGIWRKGSPFSQALVKCLRTNNIPALGIDKLHAELMETFTGYKQTIRRGGLPNTVGSDLFFFHLKDPDDAIANLFIDTILDYLNFWEERGIITAKVLPGNTDYIILSSVCGEERLSKLTGTVCSKVLLDNLELDKHGQLDYVECRDSDNWKNLAKRWSIPLDEGGLEERVIDALHGKLLSDSAMPYRIGLMFENLTPERALEIKSFCENLLKRLYITRKSKGEAGANYSPLFLFIFDKRPGTNLFNNENFDIIHDSGTACYPFILLNKQKEAISTITEGEAKQWFKKARQPLMQSGNPQIIEEWIPVQFRQSPDTCIIHFIFSVAEKVNVKPDKITQILFPK